MSPSEPVSDYQNEANFLENKNELVSNTAWEFSKANRGVVIKGGGSWFVTFRPVIDEIRQVELLKHTSVTTDGRIKTIEIQVRVVRAFPVEECDDPNESRYCPDCGEYVLDSHLREDGRHPELGWEYYECGSCGSAFRCGNAECQETTTTTFDSLSDAEEKFKELTPGFDSRKQVSLGIPKYEAPPFAEQAEMYELSVPDSLND